MITVKMGEMYHTKHVITEDTTAGDLLLIVAKKLPMRLCCVELNSTEVTYCLLF